MEKATKLYTNGVVITMNQDNLVTDSLAVCHNRILAAGSREDLDTYLCDETEIIDLN